MSLKNIITNQFKLDEINSTKMLRSGKRKNNNKNGLIMGKLVNYITQLHNSQEITFKECKMIKLHV